MEIGERSVERSPCFSNFFSQVQRVKPNTGSRDKLRPRLVRLWLWLSRLISPKPNQTANHPNTLLPKAIGKTTEERKHVRRCFCCFGFHCLSSRSRYLFSLVPLVLSRHQPPERPQILAGGSAAPPAARPSGTTTRRRVSGSAPSTESPSPLCCTPPHGSPVAFLRSAVDPPLEKLTLPNHHRHLHPFRFLPLFCPSSARRRRSRLDRH